MASSSNTTKGALDRVAWEYVQDECTAQSNLIKSLQYQLKARDSTLDYLKARLATLEIENSEMFNNLDAAREEVNRLRAKTKELESENDRLRDEQATAPPAKKLCTIARR